MDERTSNEVIEYIDRMFSGDTTSLEIRVAEWMAIKASIDAWRIMAQNRGKVIKDLEGDLQVALLQRDAKRTSSLSSKPDADVFRTSQFRDWYEGADENVSIREAFNAGWDVRTKLQAEFDRDAVPPSAARNDVAWLIEMPFDGKAHWWYGSDFIADANQAVRFSRREDANQVILERGLVDAVATEHMWLAGPPHAWNNDPNLKLKVLEWPELPDQPSEPPAAAPCAECQRMREGLQLIATDEHRLMNVTARNTAQSILNGKPSGVTPEPPDDALDYLRRAMDFYVANHTGLSTLMEAVDKVCGPSPTKSAVCPACRGTKEVHGGFPCDVCGPAVETSGATSGEGT